MVSQVKMVKMVHKVYRDQEEHLVCLGLMELMVQLE